MKLRAVSVVILAAMLVSLLSGCVLIQGKATIMSDGTGYIHSKVGFSKQFIEYLQSMSDSDSVKTTDNFDEMKLEVVNGCEYYTIQDSVEFESIEELNELLSTLNSYQTADSDYYSGDPSNNYNTELKVTDNSEIEIYLETPNSELASENESYTDLNISDEMIEEISKSMIYELEIKFPANIYYVSGPTDGITIDGYILYIDYIKLAQANPTGAKAIYRTDVIPGLVTEKKNFSDVLSDKWYYEAVSHMASANLVNGYGNDLFGPDDYITYAQFCQILANYRHLEIDTVSSDYWAYGAIQSCINKGYIEDRGEITRANYDVPMTREAAVAGMYRAASSEDLVKMNNDYNRSIGIPDIDSVDQAYKSDIQIAYGYGITNGVDANRTFNPKGSLTRAQVCQLYYNIGWV